MKGKENHMVDVYQSIYMIKETLTCNHQDIYNVYQPIYMTNINQFQSISTMTILINQYQSININININHNQS